MKTFYQLLAVAIFACSGFIQAAVTVKTVAEASEQARETKSDYIVFVYGDKWDAYGTLFKKRIWDLSGTYARLDKSTLVTSMAVPENPSKEEAEAQKKDTKGFSGRINSIPQISFFDQTGFCYALIYGDTLPKNSEQLSLKLQQIQNLRKKRDALIAQSQQASSPRDKGRLLGQAAEIPGLNRPKDFIEQLEKADPKDLSGYQKRLKFDIRSYHQYLTGPKEEALKAFKEVLDSPVYTAQQKQLILGLQSTVLRKNKGTPKELKETFQRMHDLDPDSSLGKAALNGMKAYVKQDS